MTNIRMMTPSEQFAYAQGQEDHDMGIGHDPKRHHFRTVDEELAYTRGYDLRIGELVE